MLTDCVRRRPAHVPAYRTPHTTEYVISMPNMYARGILWGKMFLELGDSCMAKNEQTGHYADIQFKTKVR